MNNDDNALKSKIKLLDDKKLLLIIQSEESQLKDVYEAAVEEGLARKIIKEDLTENYFDKAMELDDDKLLKIIQSEESQLKEVYDSAVKVGLERGLIKEKKNNDEFDFWKTFTAPYQIAILIILVVGGVFYFKFGDAEFEKVQVSVNKDSCNDFGVVITPEMVDKNPLSYKNQCFTWYAKINSITEAENGIYVFKNLKEDNRAMYGKCLLGLSTNKEGVKAANRYFGTGYSDFYFMWSEFVYDQDTEGIFEDDIVKITASVLGVESRTHPLFKDREVRYTIFDVDRLEKVEK